jgi:hypothetical protein
MAEYSPSTIVVDYSRSGFKGVGASEVIQAQGNRRAVQERSVVRLAEILGDEFVRCRRGDVGMFWNPQSRSLELDSGERLARGLIPGHIMTTTVQRVR